MQRSPNDRKEVRARRGRIVYRILVVLSAIVRRLPLGVARACGVAIGHVAWHVVRRERRIALDNLAQAFPEWSPQQRKATTRAMFHHLGRIVCEMLWLPRLDAAMRDRTTEVVGLEQFRELMGRGKGAIAITAHHGNWEWAAHCVASYGVDLTALQRERNEADINRFITNIRAHAGIRTIDRGSTAAAREMIQSLRRGGLLAFLIDQNIRAESAKVPFFGRPALTPLGPAKLAIRTETPIICIFTERRGSKYILTFQDPIEVSRDDDPIALTATITAAIEAQIRRAPEQWVWLHERWRERPKWEVTPS
jgi:Kdo2-lipid IVA lauroyltransferase/acyltransferase